jgi:predicted MPP superfamily phosphohydrolase
MSLFFIIFFTVYTAVNSYIFIRGWQAIAHIPFLKPVYAIVFIFSASSYIIARILNTNIPDLFYDILLWTGSFWFAFMLYFFLFIIFIDFSRLLNHFFGIYPSFITANYQAAKFITFLSVLFISGMVITAGYINTRNIKINYAEIEIPKKSSKLKELNLVLVADFHLTPVNDGKLLKEIVEKINFLNADIVLMPGDVLDDDVAILKKRNIAVELSNIKSKYGVFASNGNHEFIIGVEEADKYLHELNINVLRDSAVLIDNSFYVLGREDRSKRNFTGEERKTLAGILKDVNRNYPAIIIDHTPMGLNEIVNENIELQLSGHTHHGQIFPLNLITANIVYEVSWGYLIKGYTQFYVTCGVGTWGPPVRLGSDSEIVSMKIKFVD